MAKSLLWSLLIVALMAVGALMVIDQAEVSREDLMVVDTVPLFSFTDQDSNAFGQADLLDRITIVDFVFTRCMGPCPLMTEYMKQLTDFYKDAGIMQFVSVSVDPEYDTPPVLKNYARERGAEDPRWHFLTGPLDQVQDLMQQGFYLASGELPQAHSTKFVLVDQQARIRGYFDYNDALGLEVMKQNIQHLAKSLN